MSLFSRRRKTKCGALLASLAVALAPAVLAQSAAPAWWAQRGVITPGAMADDYAAVNQGQVKNIAYQAYLEMSADFSGGAGEALTDLWATPPASTDDYVAVNLGQLKKLTLPFYDELISLGYITQYPWTGSATPADDYAVANIGQVKNLFSFDPAALVAVNANAPSVILNNGGIFEFSLPGPLALSATATSSTSTITQIAFYAGTTQIGVITGSSGQINWSPSASGTYLLTAVATDANGLTTRTIPQWVQVDGVQSSPATIPYSTDFESSENYSVGPLNGQNGWSVGWVSIGGANVVNTQAFTGTQAVEIKADPLYTIVYQNFVPDSSASIVYVDFYAKPAADSDVELSSWFWTDSAEVCVGKISENLGEIEVFDADSGGWIGTGFTVPLDANGQAEDWIRLTIRTDYINNIYDVYVNGQMVAADVPAYYNTSFSEFGVYAAEFGDTLLDHVSIGTVNPLFPDVNNDGIDDAWESENGLSLATDDSAVIQPDGQNVLTDYLDYIAAAQGITPLAPITPPPPPPPVITSMVDSSGVPGDDGLVAVQVVSGNVPVANQMVTFSVISGPDSLDGEAYDGETTQSVYTDSNGYAEVWLYDFPYIGKDIISVTTIGDSSPLLITINPLWVSDFGGGEGYVLGSLDGQSGWSVVQGVATVVGSASGSNSVDLAPGATPAQIVQNSLPSFPGSNVVYVNFIGELAVEADITQSTTFEVGGARFAFVSTQNEADGLHATLEAFNGDGQGGGAWVLNNSDMLLSIPPPGGGGGGAVTSGGLWARLTVRLDFSRKTWDLYLNEQLVAADMGLTDDTLTSLTSFSVTGDANADSYIYQVFVTPSNPSFQDFNNDGIDDSWELSSGYSLTQNDRYVQQPDGFTALQGYLAYLFFGNQAPVISLADANEELGVNGSASVLVTNSSGVPFKNGVFDLDMLSTYYNSSTNTWSGPPFSATPGGTGGVVTTDINGLAQIYINSPFTNGSYSSDSSAGLPAWWTALYSLPSSAGPNGNSSGDGMSNWYKYQMGLNPNVNEDMDDTNGVPDYEAARPNDPQTGILTITITSPADGSDIQ